MIEDKFELRKKYNCGNCAYSSLETSYDDISPVCIRYPPQVTEDCKFGQFPLVQTTSICGEHQYNGIERL